MINKNIKEVFKYLDTINNIENSHYDYCKQNSFDNEIWYKEILKEVLKLDKKPKRIVDIGSNMNQFSYLFNNKGIEYIGIDLWNSNKDIKPIENKHTKFIGADYRDVKEKFKNDVIISCLCVGYLLPIEEVKAKHFIKNSLKDNKPCAETLW